MSGTHPLGELMTRHYFSRKLSAFVPLEPAAVAELDELTTQRTRTCRKGEDIISEGEDPRTVFLILEGWACRYKMLEDGRRQILALFLPGDLCDLHVYILDRMDHSIAALTPVRFSVIPPKEFDEICDAHPRAARALLWDTLVTASIQREWLVSVGQRSAVEALAHLICEVHHRMRLVGLADATARCDFPLTQHDLADIFGLTQPHISRIVAELNATGLVTLRRRQLTVHNRTKLAEFALFNPHYLHHR